MTTTTQIATDLGVPITAVHDLLASRIETTPFPHEYRTVGEGLELPEGIAIVLTAAVRNSLVGLPPIGNREFTDRRGVTVQVLGSPTVYDEHYDTPPLVVDKITVNGFRVNTKDWTITQIEVEGAHDGPLGRPDRRTYSQRGVYVLAEAPDWLLDRARKALEG